MFRHNRLYVLFLLLSVTRFLPAHWASSAGSVIEHVFSFSMAGLAIPNYYIRECEMLPYASDQATAFVHGQLKLHGAQHGERVKVKVGNVYGACHDNLIIILANKEGSPRTVLDDILDERKNGATAEVCEQAEQRLLGVKAILSHEIQHILNEDSKTLLCAQIAIPFITYGSTQILETALANMIGARGRRVSPYIKGIYRIFKGTTRSGLNKLCYYLLARF